MKKLSYRTLYMAWAVMFAVTVALGFLVPETDSVPGRIALAAAAGLFFLPPWMILERAKREENRHHIRLIRWLCVASLVLTAVLLVLTRWVKPTKKLHPIVFIALSAVVGVVLKF